MTESEYSNLGFASMKTNLEQSQVGLLRFHHLVFLLFASIVQFTWTDHHLQQSKSSLSSLQHQGFLISRCRSTVELVSHTLFAIFSFDSVFISFENWLLFVSSSFQQSFDKSQVLLPSSLEIDLLFLNKELWQIGVSEVQSFRNLQGVFSVSIPTNSGDQTKKTEPQT